MAIPKTSVALLAAIASDPNSRRWVDFYERYQPVLATFLRQHKFSTLESEDVIQDTMISFMKQLPKYR